MLKNYYKILNIDFAATTEEVKKAYRKLALLYHPDKTDNELLKAKFAEVKEAYEVLSNPVTRKKYDLTFDNFSYKKEEQLTPYQLLQKTKDLRFKTLKQDPHRMDLDRLEFEITELLSERNVHTLKYTEDKQIVQRFIEEMFEAAKPLSPAQFKLIADHLEPLANDITREKMKQFQKKHMLDNNWHRYKILFAIFAALLLCLLIYFAGR